MNKNTLIIIGTVMLFIFVAVRAPLALVMPSSFAGNAHASGTVWNGVISGLIAPGGHAATVTIDGKPLSLLALRYSADWHYQSLTMNGTGMIDQSVAQPLTVTNSQVSMDVSALKMPLPMVGSLNVNIDSLSLTPNGQCITASGTINSDALARTGASWGWQAPVLTGPIDCKDGQLVATMTGQSGNTDITAQLRPTAQGVTAQFTFDNAPLPVEFLLGQTGFVKNGQSMSWTGIFK